ncbi:hypothetical protein K438DRAFT_1777069 [Mycena galopus ATCC 62051]|nr:hypothetical protein K438DRAFT_1777069 [Mycena galopus ATCC 62051]
MVPRSIRPMPILISNKQVQLYDGKAMNCGPTIYLDEGYSVGGSEKQEEKVEAGARGQRSGEEFGMMGFPWWSATLPEIRDRKTGIAAFGNSPYLQVSFAQNMPP